ncbi:MAG: hypothetical protein WAT58_02035 [Candidatus Dormiibacterota bacterium]
MAKKIPVYIERGEKRVFAGAIDWPGWSRAAKNEDEALERLAAYAHRFAPVAAAAGLAFPKQVTVEDLEVVERVAGNATTDFGAPSAICAADAMGYGARDAKRTCDLLSASWAYLDKVVAGAPAELRKGPRGGGRDRDKMFDHVLGAEFDAYARKIGLRIKTPDIGDRTGIKAARQQMLAVLSWPYDGSPPEGKNWPPAYTARRTAWHALDHAWEIEDRLP